MKLVWIISLLLLASCQTAHVNEDEKSKQNSISTHNVQQNNSIDPEHTVENSLDWLGSYRGKFPCPNCDSLDVHLTLKFDKTYELKKFYKIGALDYDTSVSGSFVFDTKNPSLIILDSNAQNQKFFVGENFVELRDSKTSQEIHQQNNYKLIKIYF